MTERLHGTDRTGDPLLSLADECASLGKPCPTERIFYIQYGPNPDDVCRWENAQCRVIATAEISDELHGR